VMPDKSGIIMSKKFEIEGKDYINGGRVSSEIRDILKFLNIPSDVVRKAGIAAYEAEMNVIIYARRGELNLIISNAAIEIIIEDEGDGIENIEMAMSEGYSTASAEIRELGFGAGMGLPNIKRNSSEFQITSEMNKGTRLYIRINMN
jgi:serine/threonine-protein kinase RsbT